jgi:hypothetical protein
MVQWQPVFVTMNIDHLGVTLYAEHGFEPPDDFIDAFFLIPSGRVGRTRASKIIAQQYFAPGSTAR